MLRALTLGLALLVPLPAALAEEAPKNKKADEAKGLKVEGKLNADDPKDKVIQRNPHQVHPFPMAAGKTYIIDLVSRDFDSYLRLEDSAGKQLAQDDDSGGFPNARITFKAPKEDTYRIIVTCYDGKTGNYTLTANLASAAFAGLAALQEEHKQETQKLFRDFSKAKTEEERDKLKDDYYELSAKALEQFSNFAEENADDPAAKEARKFVSQTLDGLSASDSAAVGRQLRALADKASQKELRGQASLVLGQNLIRQYERAYQKKDKDAGKLAAEAEALLKQTAANYGDVSLSRGKLADQVKDVLFGLEHLTVGKAAMDIAGEDLDGKTFKLSDYRGKVVALDFWGNW